MRHSLNCRLIASVILVVIAGHGLLTSSVAGQSATVKLPVFDQRIESPEFAGDSGEEPHFGYTMVMGNVDAASPIDRDDLIVSAIHKDISTATDAGKVYAFAGPNLGPHTFDEFSPASAQVNENFGRLTIILADVVGSATDPDDEPALLFVPAPGRRMSIDCGGGATNVDVGSIDVFDLTAGVSAIRTITPPAIPGASPSLPCDVRYFGHWLAHGDIDGDDFNDLIVGAPSADQDVGRVYIFFGHEDFFETSTSYYERWMILRPPPSPSTGDPFVADRQFGFSVAAADLDEDGKAEVLVGSVEHAVRMTSLHGPGRAFLFHGYWLASQLYYLEDFADVTPDAPEDIDEGVGGLYETLIDPRTGTFAPTPGRGFGWIVDMSCGDLGQPINDPNQEWALEFDDRPDIIVHSEGALGYGRNANFIVDGGANFMFMNNSDPESDESLVDELEPAILMTPRIKNGQGVAIYFPQSEARFGRGFATLDWQRTNGAPTRLLVVGEPERSVMHPNDDVLVAKAGAVFAFELPLDPHFDPNDLNANHINAWGSFVLMEPSESLTQNNEEDLTTSGHVDPTDGALWGAWIVKGVYDPTFPGEQIAICARARDVTIGSTTYPGLGRVYTVTLSSD